MEESEAPSSVASLPGHQSEVSEEASKDAEAKKTEKVICSTVGCDV